MKEMCKHLPGRLRDPTFIPPSAVHTFLIRHPVKTIKSFITGCEKALGDMKEGEMNRHVPLKLGNSRELEAEPEVVRVCRSRQVSEPGGWGPVNV